jgi:hypothetical protein
MPYASSIQTINDANGTAYGFLEVDGLLWQCQWNPQAQRWDRGTIVPGAYGGEKLQALLVDDLWPSDSNSTNPPVYAPGVVLAYTLGEGESAMVYATLGQWGSDGQLSWSEPLLLAESGSVVEGIALAASGKGGFALVRQTREATDSGATAAAPTAPRKDSELISQSFALSGDLSSGYSLADTTTTTGTINSANPTQPISRAANSATSAAPALAVGGNTQISRSALQLAPAASNSLQALDTLQSLSGSLANAAATSGDIWPSWKGKFFFGNPNSTNSIKWKLGLVPGGVRTEWRLKEREIPRHDWYFLNKSSLKELTKNNEKTTSQAAAALARWEENNDENQDSRLLSNLHHWKKKQSDATDKINQVQSLTGAFREKKENEWVIKGSYGIDAYGQKSISNTFGLQHVWSTKGANGDINKAIRAFNEFDSLATLTRTSKSSTFASNLTTKYSYSNLIPSSDDFALKSVSDSASFSLGGDYKRSQRLETGGYVEFNAGASVGAVFKFKIIPTQKGSNMPSWLRNLGYLGGGVGVIQSELTRQTENFSGIWKRNAPIDYFVPEKPKATRGSIFNTVVGGILTLAPPLSSIGEDVSVDTLNVGFQGKGQLGVRYLYKGAFGVYVNANDSLTKDAFSTGGWQNSLNVIGGFAFPLGVSIPLINLSWTYPNPSKPKSTNSSLSLLPSAGTSAGSDPDYSFSYAPAQGSTLLPLSSSNTGVPVAGSTAQLQLLGLIAYGAGAVMPAQATSSTPVVLTNAGAALVDGSYSGVPIMGVLLPGSTPATLSFTVVKGSIHAESLRIDDPGPGGGQYLQLPQTTSDSGIYALIPDVFSSGILPGPANAASSGLAQLLRQLPVISVNSSSISGTPLSIQSIAAIQPLVPVPAPTASNPSQIVPNPSPSDNSLQSYSDVPISLSGAHGISPLNQVTATVSLSNGVIVKVLLDQPLMFSYQGTPPPTSLTLSLDLQAALGSDVANPSYTVTPQTLGLNNVVEDHSYQTTRRYPANSGQGQPSSSPAQAVWLEDGINSEWQPTSAQAAWPVFNRVVVRATDGTLTYLNTSTTGSNGVVVQTTESPSDVTLQALYNDLTDPLRFGAIPNFSAASTPAVVSLAADATARFGGASAVFWVEASVPVIAQVSSDGSENYQAFMQALYGQQRINYRLFDPKAESWTAPRTLDLYEPDHALIRHLRAFNVQVDGTTRTLLVWDETSLDSIQETPPLPQPFTGWISGSTLYLSGGSSALRIGDLITGDGVEKGSLITAILTPFDPTTGQASYQISRNQSVGSSNAPAGLNATALLPPTVLKAGFINPNAQNLQWNSLFSDGYGNSTITTIPWDQANDIGIGIESLSVASHQSVDASGVVRDTAVLSWSENVRTPYVQSVLNDAPLIYLQFAYLQPGSNDINIGSTAAETTTGTYASSSGLNFTIASALPKSGASAVQNVDGTGALSTGTGSQNALTVLAFNSTPNSQLASTLLGQLTASISGTTLTVTALNGALEIGDLLTGPGLQPDTQITEVIQAFDPISGSGTYGINLNQNLSSTTLLALPNPAPRGSGELGLAYSSLIGTINGTTLSVSQLTGSLAVGDWIEGEGVSFGTTITAVQSFDPASGSGLYTLSQSQQSESLPASALIATPSSSVPYTIEFWARLPAGSNAEHGAGLVAFGQPSEQAVGPAVAPSGWLMSASFSVQPITYQDAAAQGFEDAYNKLSSNSATANDPYGWAWSLDATGANTTTLGGNGGSNLYSNALNLSNLYSGQTLTGVDAFLSAYGLKAADLVGVDGLLANTIALIPGTSMDFNNSLDPLSGLPVSNLNGVSIDTASSQLNSGLVQVLDTNGTLSSDATTNSHLQAMFQALWNYQQQYGEAKVGFTLDPAAAANPGSGFEQYGGYSLDFAISAGPAISVNNLGQLVFDVASDISLTSAATNPSGGRQSALPSDLRDGEWHHVVATYLPDYRSYTINGVVTQVPINQGTASLYVDNQLVASREGISDAFLATNINDTALLLAGNAGGAIDQFALYNKALLPAPPLPVNASGAWPAPSQQEVLAVLKQLGYPATADTPNPGAIQSAISEHWRSRDVNPNNALLATFSSTFSPSSSGSLSGSWSEAAPLNPSPAPVASTPSASAPSLQQDLLVAIKPGDWATNGNWFVGTNATSGTEFNPAGKQLKTITVTLTPSGSTTYTVTRTLSPGQVLMGGNSVTSLQPRASTDNLNTTLLSATPALNLLIARKDDDPLDSANSGDLDLSKSYSASVTLTFADGPTVSNTSGSSQQTSLHLSVNNAGAGLIGNINADATSNSTVTNRSKALATAAVIETAPLQLKYIDSGVVLNSASSQQAANSPATSSPAPTFGQSMAYGWFQSGSSTPYSGWLAIAQPSSANAISDPAGRAWIQYTGDFTSSDPENKPHTAVSVTGKAPSTWLNALANSNFSPEAANRPLLNDAMNPAAYGGLLIQADPTLGWGQNFAQTMLVADINGDGVLDLVISAPSANSGGKVVIIDGNWIKANLTNPGANTTLNLANPDNAGPHVLVLSPGQRQSNYEEDASQSAFGWALAFDAVSKTLYIGAPNYSREVGTDRESVPIGAVYHYESPSTTFASGQQTLATPTVGIAGRTDTNDVGGPASSYWGAQLGASLAVSDTRQLAIGAPGVQASLLYSGTEAVNQLVAGKRNPSDPYGQGALVKVMLPTTNNDPDSREGVDVYVSSSDGTANTSLVDVISNNTSKKKSDLAQEESAYMQALKELQAKTIAKANAVNNSAIQTAAVGSVYLIDITNGTPPPAGTLKPSNAQATFYGSNPWNVGGATDFGASLAFGDTANSNAQNLLAIGAPSTGGPGAVYLINTSLPFDQPSTAPTWITETNLGNKQYLAYLTSGLTLYGAEDLDQFGAGLVNLGDSNSDGYDDLLIQAPNASSGAGNGYVVFGSDQLIATNTLNTGSNSSNGSLLGGHNPAVGSVQSGSIGQLSFADGTPGRKISILSELGHGVAAATGLGSFSSGDVDANGNNDILLGSGSNGQAYLTYGHSYLAAIDNLQLQKLAGNTGYLLDGLASTTQGSLRSIGDFNGDGYGDFFSIQPGTFLDTVRIELGANTQEILADYPYNYYSFQVASGTEVLPAGDINGDGYSDIALFLQQNLSSVAGGNAGAGSTTGILYGRPSDQLPLGSGFGLLAPVDASSNPLAPLPTGPISGALSTQAPAMLAMGSTIYSVWCDALAGSTNLWFAQSRDGGTSWSSSTNLSAALPALASGSTPSLTLFSGKLHLGFRNGSGQLSLSSWDPTSGDPTLWSNPTLLSNGGTTPTSLLSPSLIPNGDALSVVWVDDTTRELQGSTTTTPDLYSSSGSLGTASSWKAVSDGASPSTPALANEGNTVYMAMRGENSQLYWNSSSDGGQSWRGWQELPSGMTSNDAPSLAIVNGSPYLTYLGVGNQELHITQLTNAATNTWSTQTLVSNQSARNGLGAVAISETVNGREGLAIYYVANNTIGTILRTWSSTPLNAGSWSGSQQLGVTSTNTNGFTSSSPLAVAQFQGNTVLAYMGDASTTNTTAYIATAGNTPSITGNWTTISTLNTGNQYGIGLSSDPTGLLLNTSDTGSGQQAIYRLSPPAVSGSWSQTFYTSRASISSSSPTAALLSLPSNGNTPQLLLAAADQANAGAIDVSAFYPEALNSSWSSATPLLERLVATDGSVSFQPITASAAPSATLINGSPVLAVNNGDRLNLYTGSGGKTFSLASSFSPFGGADSGTTPAGLTTTDTGLALSYLNAPYSVSLQRLNFLQLDGTPVDGVVFNADGSIDTSKANLQWQGLNLGLGTNLASVPLSVNGTLLLGSTSDNSNQVQLSAIPVLSNPGSTTWLNSTVQLPDGQGGWTLQQQAGGSNLSAVGDLTGDGNADLLVTAAADQSGGNTFTGLRLISGAATSSQILAANDATASSQTVQVAASFGSGFSTPVASLSGTVGGVPQLTLTATDTTSGEPYSLSAGFNLADFSASAGNLPSAQEVFSSTAAPTAVGPGLGLTFGDLSLSTSSSFGDLNADGYLDHLEGTPTTVYGANGLGWHVWSIRAAGDVNGNGTDDILLSLVPPETVLNDAPQWIQPVLVDGALFEVDRATNSFSFSDMRRALNPEGVLQQKDLNSTSSSQPWPLLQNWLQPILAYEHPATNSPGAIDFSLSSTTTIGEAFPVNVAASVSGENGLIYLLSNSSGTVSISQYDPSSRRVMWTKAVPTTPQPPDINSSTSDTNDVGPNSATIYNGRLYFVSIYRPNGINWSDGSKVMLSSIDCTSLAQAEASSQSSDWNQQWTQEIIKFNESDIKTKMSASLVNEGDRLGLYYVTEGAKSYFNLAYYYLQPQAGASAKWTSGSDVPNGLVRANNGDYDNPSEFVQLYKDSGSWDYATQNIVAARFQHKTYVAYVSQEGATPQAYNVWVIERPEDPSKSGIKWNSSNRIQTRPWELHLNGNETQLNLTAWKDYKQGYSNTYVFESRGIGEALKQNNLINPSSTSILTSSPSDLSGTALIGSQLTLIRRGGQLQTLATPWSSVKKPSLAGYSIDGNIDTNGDGFMDMLVSDPSDAKQNVDNQYVLFGGDYLNIASQVGTPGDDVIVGTPLADVIYSIQGADQVSSNGGADVIYTGAGDDAISIQDNTFIRIDAGSGFDALQLEGLAHQSYDFRLNIPSPEYFAGTKLRDIELISSFDYGANTLSFDAAAVNAINPDRVLFLTPDASDSITLSTEFNRNASFDTSFGGTLWSAYAAAPASATPASGNPALVYVAVPTGQTFGWLSTNVSLTDTPAAAPASALRAAAAPAGTAASDPPTLLPTTSPIADTQVFGDGLTLLAYRTGPSTGMARFAIERSDPSKRQVVLYASSSANGSAKPGSYYTAVAGLLVFEPGQTSHEVTVAIDSVAFARLGSGSLSLQVEELQDQGQTSLHLLITPTAATAAAALQPVLSSFELSAAENGTSAILSFRADSTSGNPDSLQLTVSQRDRADSDGSLNSQNLQILDFGTPTTYPISSISDPVPLDNDGRKNNQVSTSLKLNFAPKNGEASVSVLGPAPVLEQTVQQVGTDQIRFQHNGPLTSWRSDSGSGSVTFGLQAGTTSETLLTAASGGSVGSIDPARALDNSPQAGWQGSEGLAVGSRSITTVANVSAQAWTPTATRNGVALNLQDISINGNQVTARFQGGVAVEFWQASGTAPSLVPIAPAVEVKRLAGYNNTIGFYSVDSITGLVDGRSPGEAGYLQAALARSEAEKLLLSAAELPAFGQSATFNALPLNSQKSYGVLVLQNGDRNTLFSSFSAANPGGETQMVRLGSDPSSYVLGIEDLAVASGRSDRDFNDNILTINGVSLGLF